MYVKVTFEPSSRTVGDTVLVLEILALRPIGVRDGDIGSAVVLRRDAERDHVPATRSRVLRLELAL